MYEFLYDIDDIDNNDNDDNNGLALLYNIMQVVLLMWLCIYTVYVQ